MAVAVPNGAVFSCLRPRAGSAAVTEGDQVLRAAIVRTRLFALVATASLIVGLLPLATANVAQAAVLRAPTLISPVFKEGEAVNPLFSWTAVPGAAKYKLELSLEAGFSPLISGFPVTTQELLYAPPVELPLGTIHWRVAALDAGNTVGAYAAGNFVKPLVSAPSVLTPINAAELKFPTDPVLFSWNALPGAASYQLEIDDATDFIGADAYTTKNTAFVMTEPVTVGQNFYWRVRGVSGSVSSAWSSTRMFTSVWPYVPVLKYPVSGARDVTDVYFDWDPVLGARSYQLQVSPNGDWANNKTIDIAIKSTRYTPPKPLNNGNYYWRVRALDAASSPNYGSWSDNDRVFQRGWSDTPEILWPEKEEGASDAPSTSVANPDDPTWQNPTFSWTPAKRASWYRIRFATNVGMTNGLKGCITNRTTWTPYLSVAAAGGTLTEPGAPAGCSASLVAGTTYYWDVAALDAPVENTGIDIWGPPNETGSVVMGLRSPVKSFVYDPPAAPAPAIPPALPAVAQQLTDSDYLTPLVCDPDYACTTAEQDTPVLTWSADPAATGYKVTVALDPNFTNVYRVYTTSYNRLAPRDSWRDNQANQAYYWNVTPIGLPLDTSNFSVFQKRTAKIQLVSPVHATDPLQDNFRPDDFTFEWDDYLVTNQALDKAVDQEATQYRIQVSAVSDFATEIDNQVVNTPFYTPASKTYPEGPIYWRVQAIDGSNNDLTMSDSTLVTKKSDAPTLLHPGDGLTVLSVPYVQWAPLAFAASYDVQLDNDQNFSSPIATVTTKMTAWAHIDPLAAGTYFWRVRRNDADGRDGAWSDARSNGPPDPSAFVLQPSPPKLTSPNNGANPSPSTLLLEWSATQPSPKYRVELSTSSSFAGQVSGYPKDTVMSSWAPTTMLTNGTYYWRVNALNAAGTPMATSIEPWKFTIDSSSPSVISLTPSTSADIATAFTVKFDESVVGVSASSFKVTIAGTSTVVAGKTAVLLSTMARFTPSARLVPGQTYNVNVSSSVTDRSGNPLLPFSANVRTSTTVQETSPAIGRSWAQWKKSAASGGTLRLSQSASSRLTFPFIGTSIALVGYQGSTGGYASIYLDGVRQPTKASFYARSDKFKATIWSRSALKSGPHTLVLVVDGNKPKASKGNWVFVDAFIVGGSTVQENASSVTNAFRHVNAGSASGGGYDLTDFATGSGRTSPTLGFTFKGTGITWYGTRSTKSGKASVYIDGVKKATIDLYASRTGYRQKLWVSKAISNTVHTIKVVVLGSKGTKAKGYEVSFDSFTIN